MIINVYLNLVVLRLILTTIEDCVYSCELTEAQMKIAQDLMHVFMKENELKEKTKKIA